MSTNNVVKDILSKIKVEEIPNNVTITQASDYYHKLQDGFDYFATLSDPEKFLELIVETYSLNSANQYTNVSSDMDLYSAAMVTEMIQSIKEKDGKLTSDFDKIFLESEGLYLIHKKKFTRGEIDKQKAIDLTFKTFEHFSQIITKFGENFTLWAPGTESYFDMAHTIATADQFNVLDLIVDSLGEKMVTNLGNNPNHYAFVFKDAVKNLSELKKIGLDNSEISNIFVNMPALDSKKLLDFSNLISTFSTLDSNHDDILSFTKYIQTHLSSKFSDEFYRKENYFEIISQLVDTASHNGHSADRIFDYTMLMETFFESNQELEESKKVLVMDSFARMFASNLYKEDILQFYSDLLEHSPDQWDSELQFMEFNRNLEFQIKNIGYSTYQILDSNIDLEWSFNNRNQLRNKDLSLDFYQLSANASERSAVYHIELNKQTSKELGIKKYVLIKAHDKGSNPQRAQRLLEFYSQPKVIETIQKTFPKLKKIAVGKYGTRAFTMELLHPGHTLMREIRFTYAKMINAKKYGESELEMQHQTNINQSIYLHVDMMARLHALAPLHLGVRRYPNYEQFQGILKTPAGKEPSERVFSQNEIEKLHQNLEPALKIEANSPYVSLSSDRNFANGWVMSQNEIRAIDPNNLKFIENFYDLFRGMVFGGYISLEKSKEFFEDYIQTRNLYADAVKDLDLGDNFAEGNIKSKLRFYESQENEFQELAAKSLGHIQREEFHADTIGQYMVFLSEKIDDDSIESKRFLAYVSGQLMSDDIDDMWFHGLNTMLQQVVTYTTVDWDVKPNESERMLQRGVEIIDELYSITSPAQFITKKEQTHIDYLETHRTEYMNLRKQFEDHIESIPTSIFENEEFSLFMEDEVPYIP